MQGVTTSKSTRPPIKTSDTRKSALTSLAAATVVTLPVPSGDRCLRGNVTVTLASGNLGPG